MKTVIKVVYGPSRVEYYKPTKEANLASELAKKLKPSQYVEVSKEIVSETRYKILFP